MYQDLLTMREYGLSPRQWGRLSRYDKKLLHYARAVECYHMEIGRMAAGGKV